MLWGHLRDIIRILKAQPDQRRRLDREWLGRRVPFPRHVPFGNRTLLYWVDRLASHAVKNEQQSILGHGPDCWNLLAVLDHIKQHGRDRHVIVPKIVVDR